MKSLSKASFLLISLFLTVGCSTQAIEVGTPRNVVPIPTIDTALATMVDVCYEAAPTFQSFDRRIPDNEPSPNGWFNHISYDASFALREYSTHYSCQFAFSADEAQSVFVSRMDTPLNAREFTSQEVARLFSVAEDPAIAEAIANARVFASRTDFDGTPAVLFGFILAQQASSPNGGNYGLILRVWK